MSSILAVDDSASMREMVRFTLGEAGYSVVEACDGVDALEKAGQQRFALVLADVNMPNMDGIELVRRLRALPEYRFVPILMLTTESGADRKAEGKAAGATGWIVKPFSPTNRRSKTQSVTVPSGSRPSPSGLRNPVAMTSARRPSEEIRTSP